MRAKRMNNKKEKNKIIIIIVILVLISLMLLTIFIFNVSNKIKNTKKAQEIINDYTNSPEYKYQSAISEYEEGNFEEAKEIFQELGDYEESQKYIYDIEKMSYIQGIWVCEESSSLLNIRGNSLESYSCFGFGDSSIYKYLIGNTKYFKVDSRSGKIKLENGKIVVYDILGEEIDNVKLEYDKEKDNIFDITNTLSGDLKSIYKKEELKITEIKDPTIGMTKSEVENSTWGEPEDINRTITTYGTREQWCYSNYRYIYFEDGIVTSIQD